jgi:hypothetical protein
MTLGLAQPARTVIGLDVGTSRVVAIRESGGQRTTRSELNSFLTLPWSGMAEASLRRESVPYLVQGGEIIVIGNESARLADLLGREVRRPMTRGMLNPDEPESLTLIRAILRAVLEPEITAGAKVRFSVPSPPLNGESTLTFHEASLRQILEDLGYPDSGGVNEGVAVVYSELFESNYTGIGISFGGGLCNAALAYLSVPALCFSIPKAGDYIDSSAAAAAGEMVTRARLVKEQSFHFNGNYPDKVQQALAVYYDDMIQATAAGLRQALQGCRSLPRFGRALPLVLSGGGVLPEGFRERFEKALGQAQLPVAISEVRLARRPLQATAEGALAAALSE